MAEHFPVGSNCADLRQKFQEVANRKAATFYAALDFCKSRGWIVSDGATRGSVNKIYSLNPDGSWRPPPIGADIERHQFEHVLEMREARIEKLEAVNRRLTDARKAVVAGENGPAIGTLVQLMTDSSIPIRARLQAAENLLAYKTPTAVTESAKLFLTALSSDSEQNVDYRLAALAALRKSEDARIMPPIERPSPPVRNDIDPAAEEEARRIEFERKREHCDRLAEQIIRELGPPQPTHRHD
jgi:hypothetical protein